MISRHADSHIPLSKHKTSLHHHILLLLFHSFPLFGTYILSLLDYSSETFTWNRRYDKTVLEKRQSDQIEKSYNIKLVVSDKKPKLTLTGMIKEVSQRLHWRHKSNNASEKSPEFHSAVKNSHYPGRIENKEPPKLKIYPPGALGNIACSSGQMATLCYPIRA